MRYFVVDVFTDRLFGGNPAGVCLVDGPLSDSDMQNIAFENNLPETAFLVEKEGYYDLRWFTPMVEIDLCGHATLGSAFVLMNYVNKSMQQVTFQTKSGVLTVKREIETLKRGNDTLKRGNDTLKRNNDTFIMDFPSRKPVPCKTPDILERALGTTVLETLGARDLLVLAGSEAEVRGLKPDFELLKRIDDVFAVIVTAKGEQCDFVSRFFAPNAGIDEDPVTGSSHCTLIPFWSERLGKASMTARQLSQRGGALICRACGDRVEIGGTAVCYLSGDIALPRYK